MKVHNVQQGSPEWHALRANYFTASEAPAMMGASKYQTRDDLLAMKKTGIVDEPEESDRPRRALMRGEATPGQPSADAPPLMRILAPAPLPSP